MEQINCDVAVIGAGPAGLAAAKSAYENGAKEVILIERDKYLGGILQQCIHNGFGIHLLGEDRTGPEYAEHFIKQVKALPINCLMETMVLGLSENLAIKAANKQGIVHIQPGAVVLAMGCRERTRGAIALPGKRPAGIMTAGTAQRFINIEGYLPGKNILIIGSGDIGMIIARRLHLEGAQVQAVVEIMDCLGGLLRNLVQCLQDFEIPLYLRHIITDIRGDKRIESVDFAPLGDDNQPQLDKKISMECDTLLLSVGLIPENELSKQAGVQLDGITRGPVVDQYFHTSTTGIFAAGNVAQVFDLVDHVSICGIQAGKSAALYANNRLEHFSGKASKVKAGLGIGSVMPQVLSSQANGELKFYLRAKEVKRKVTLQLRNNQNELVFKKKFRTVRPAEMMSVSVDSLECLATEYTFELIGEENG